MTEPDQSNADLLKQGFEKLKEGAEFYQMGPLLIDIMRRRSEVDISDDELKKAFFYVIQYHLNDGNIDKALPYYVRSFAVDGIVDEKRLEYINQLFKFLKEHEEELVWEDYQDIIKHLRRQIKYLQVYSENTSLIAQLNNFDGRLSSKQVYSDRQEEGPMRAYISSLMNLFYQNLPDEESLDYASQILLENRKR